MKTFAEALEQALQEANSLTSKPNVSPIFKANEQQIFDNVMDKISKIVMEEIIRKGGNNYGAITKILEQTIALIGTMSAYDSEMKTDKYTKNPDRLSALLGYTKEEYIIWLNNEIKRYQTNTDAQAFALNKLLDKDIKIKY